MARTAFFSVRQLSTKGCGVLIRARDPDAKQTLWGWGSDRRPSIEFYGRDAEPFRGDSTLTEWQLSAEGLAELRQKLAEQIANPKRYEVSAREDRMARQLKRKLDQVAASCARKKS